jgi:hypothetical protein
VVDPELIAEAFINKRPYYDGKYLVTHYSDYFEDKSAVCVDVKTGIGWLYGRPILYVSVARVDVREGAIVVYVDPRSTSGEGVEVLDAVLRRLKDLIGVEMRAVRIGNRTGVAVNGFKYVFLEHHVMTKVLDRGGVRIVGYVKRFAPFSVCRECVEVAERIKELSEELKWKSKELIDIVRSLVITGFNPVRVRELALRALRMAESNVVVDGVGLYIGSDSPRALLSRYEKAAREVSELLDDIKTKIALEKLLS